MKRSFKLYLSHPDENNLMRELLLDKIRLYSYLIRLDKPIGFLLLLWPTLSALFLASRNIVPSVSSLIVFTLGTFLMRSAGCVINDFIDRDIDIFVRRTKNRPLSDGKLNSKEVITVFIVLIIFAFSLVITLNTMTVTISVLSLASTIVYPLMKRYTYFPQLVLGIAFSSAILMAWAATSSSLPLECWLMFFANIFWILAYDTEYAMMDREDDITINIKSTAIIFGRFDRLFIGLFQACMIAMMVVLALEMKLNLLFYCALIAISILFIYQQILLSFRDNRCYLKAFLNNNYVGIILFFGVLCNISYH